jgi:hypothetical protein
MGISMVSMNPVEATVAEQTISVRFVLALAASKENPLRHDPAKLTAALLDLYARWRALNEGTARVEEQGVEVSTARN